MSKTVLLLALAFMTLVLRAQKRPITDEEAIQLAHHIETVTARGGDALNHFIDMDSLIENMRKKYDVLNDSAFMSGFRPSFIESMSGLGNALAGKAKGGNYKLLREYDKDGTKHLLYRAFGDLGLSYHDYILIRVKDSIRASDVYLSTTDETLSNVGITMVKSIVDAQGNNDASEEARDLIEFRDQADNDYAAAKKIYDKLDSSHISKSTRVIYLDVCRNLNDSLYERELEHFAATFPDAPGTYTKMIPLYYERKKIDKGLRAVDKLDNIIGKDPFLDFYRGNFCLLAGKKDEALAYYKKVYRYDPDMAINTRQLIDAYADAGQIDQAKMVIREYKKSTGFRQDYLNLLYTKDPVLKN